MFAFDNIFNNMTINEKFEVIIKTLFDGNKRAFAKTVDISPTVVENVVGARQGKPSFDVVQKVCANANISAEWLLLGDGHAPIKDVFKFRKDMTITDETGERVIAEFFTKKPENEDQNNGSKDTLIELIREKDSLIIEQAQTIGELKERIRQLERERGQNASGATSIHANVG